jgi:hypothetical protein
VAKQGEEARQENFRKLHISPNSPEDSSRRTKDSADGQTIRTRMETFSKQQKNS